MMMMMNYLNFIKNYVKKLHYYFIINLKCSSNYINCINIIYVIKHMYFIKIIIIYILFINFSIIALFVTSNLVDNTN